MNNQADKPRRGIRKWVNANTVGIVMLLAAACVSIGRVISIQKENYDPTKRILRISHWQLELGFRDALQVVIDKFEKMHPDVKVIQIPVTEKVYGQWLNTQLISGTAPDLAEVGIAKLATDTQYIARFFMPLTELVNSPNPHNKGTSLEHLPWRETFIDGMRGGYNKDLQDYFKAPTTMGTVRLFYNKQLLKEATGSDHSPKTLGGLIKACDAIREFSRKTGRKIYPIAGSKYNAPKFLRNYKIPFTSSFEAQLDTNLDGSVTSIESYAGFVQGKVSMHSPAIRAYYQCMKIICNQFVEGFLGMGRQQAAGSFVQGKAAIIATGAWDAMSLFKQAKFEIGITDFPLPAKGERWSEFVTGRGNEASSGGGGSYAVYKYSANRELAIDFLRFMTSQKGNELLNRSAEWIPAVIGARVSERMKPFKPNPVGFNTSVNFSCGNYATTKIQGQLDKYLGGNTIDYSELADKAEAALKHHAGGDHGWALEHDRTARWCRSQERVLTVQFIRNLMDTKAHDAAEKYRRVMSQQVRKNNGHESRYRFEKIRGKPIPKI